MSDDANYNSGERKDLADGAASPGVHPESGGGQGETFGDRKHSRADAKLVGRAIRERWNIPADVLDRLPAKALQLVIDESTNKREKIRAMELLRRMHADNQAADEFCTKEERLDEGLPTERIELKPITLRVAEKINPSPSDNGASPSDSPPNPSDNGADR